jgi:uncharacterized membrane protein
MAVGVLQARRNAVAGAIGLFGLTCLILWRTPADGDVAELHDYGHAVLSGQVPYRDFALEYPPGSIPLFTLPALGHFVTWYRVENAVAWGLVLALTAVLLFDVQRGRRANAMLLGLLALAPVVIAPFSLLRFDGWPTACVLATLVLLRRHPNLALLALGVGTLIKTWPVLLVPLVLAYGVSRRALATFAAVVVAGWAPFAIIAHGGAYNSVMFEVDRHLEFESVGASVLSIVGRPVHLYFGSGSWNVAGSTANAIADVQSTLQIVLALVVALVYRRSGRRPADLVAAAAATVAVAAAVGKVLSPQYLLWLAPFAVLCDGAALACFAVACVASRALFLGRFSQLREQHAGPVAMLVARNGFLVAATIALLRRAVRL